MEKNKTKDERVKFRTLCPHCDAVVEFSNFCFTEMLVELEEVGKYVSECPKCKRYFLIRDEGEGLFTTIA